MNQTATTATDPSDVELMQSAGRGDRSALRQIYQRWSRGLYSFAARLTGNASDAEDLVQEVFIEIWRRAPQFDPRRAKPRTWALAIIRNKAVDRVRQRTRRESILEASAADVVELSTSSETAEARDQVWSRESALLVRNAFQSLPDDQRTTLELAYFEGLTHQEIAARQNEPLGTVKSRIRRGLLRLRDGLANRL